MNRIKLLLCAFYILNSSVAVAYSIPFIQPQKRYLDMHVHGACIEKNNNNCFIHPNFFKNIKFDIFINAFGITKKELAQSSELLFSRLSVKIEDSHYLNSAIVLALDGYYNQKTGELDRAKTQVKFSNKAILNNIRKFDNLLFGASVNPYRSDALERLKWAKANGAVLIKWLPSIMGINPASTGLKITAFYKKLIELDLPLLVHVGNEKTFLWADDKLSNPVNLKRPLEMGVKVIAAHMGASGRFDNGKGRKVKGVKLVTQMLDEYDNLYYDISALTQINKSKYLKIAIKHQRRALYGSDWPLISVKVNRIPYINVPMPFEFWLVNWRFFRGDLTEQWITFLSASENHFDQDIALKHGLGFNTEVFERTLRFFNQ